MTIYQAIILDFDNVILESVDIKTEAFAELFADYPQQLEKIIRFHLNNKGVSRFDKFRYIYQHILKEPLTEERFQQLCDDFSRIVYEQVLKCPFVPGTKEFLKRYHLGYDLYIVSATPQEEIQSIVSALDIASYFKGVFGSPTKKGEHIRQIIAEHGYNPKNVLVIGDSNSDYEAACAVGCDFIGRVPQGESNCFEGLSEVRAVVQDLTQMEEYL